MNDTFEENYYERINKIEIDIIFYEMSDFFQNRIDFHMKIKIYSSLKFVYNKSKFRR